MTGNAQLGGLDPTQEIGANGLDLLAVGAALVKLKEFFGFAAALTHIHSIVHYHVITAEDTIHLVVADIGQFLVLVGLAVHGLLDQLAGQDLRRALVVTAVGQIDVGLSALCHRNAHPDIARSGAKGI